MAKYNTDDVRMMIECASMCMEKLKEIEFIKDADEHECALVSASIAQGCANATKFILNNGKLTPKMRAFFKKSMEYAMDIMHESMQVMDEDEGSDDDDDESDYYDDESDWMDDDKDDALTITDKDMDAYAEYYGLNKEERKVLAKIVANKGSREGMTPHQIEVGKKIAEKVDAKEGGKAFKKH